MVIDTISSHLVDSSYTWQVARFVHDDGDEIDERQKKVLFATQNMIKLVIQTPSI